MTFADVEFELHSQIAGIRSLLYAPDWRTARSRDEISDRVSTIERLIIAQSTMLKLEWSLAIDRIVPDLSPEPDQNEYPAEWSVWADRQRIRRELSLLSAPPAAMVMINEKPIQRRPSYGESNMEDQVIEKKIDDRRSAKVTWNEYGCHLLTLNNGRQWSGAAIYSVEVAEAAIEVLKAYVKQQKQAVDEDPNLRTAAQDLFKQLYETHCMLMFEDAGYLESDLYIKNAEALDKARRKP